MLAEVVQPRYEELLTLVQSELRRSGYEDMVPAGVVLTGGAAKIEGLIELAEEIFHMPVRIGIPQGATGMADVTSNPIHATGVGLLLFGQSRRVRAWRRVPQPGWWRCCSGSRTGSEASSEELQVCGCGCGKPVFASRMTYREGSPEGSRGHRTKVGTGRANLAR